MPQRYKRRTHQISVEDVINELEEELVQKEQGSTTDFACQNVERDLGEQLDGWNAHELGPILRGRRADDP